jgi:ABC-type glycerol-3-phosphate transport system substrate-binding protein
MTSNRFVLVLVAGLVLSLVALSGAASGGAKRQGVSGTISIIAKWTGGEQDSFMAVLEPFKKANPDVEIKYQGAGDNTPQIVSTALQGGNPPDMATLPQPGLMKQFANGGKLKPMTFVKASYAKNVSPDWVKIGTVKGKLYGIFLKVSNKSTVWNNVKAFKDAGVKAPATWPKFLAAGKTIRASGLPPFSIAGANGWTLTDLFENIYLRTAGAAKYDALTAHKIKWTDPTVKAALKQMAALFTSSNMAGGTSGALQTDFPTSVNNALSASPKAAMVIEADFVPTAITDTDLKPVKDYNVFPFPTIGKSSPSTVLAGGDVIVMFKDTAAVRALVKYLATPGAATIWAKLGGFTAANKKVPASAYGDALNRKTAIALAKATLTRFDMSDQQPAAFGSTVGQGEWKLFQDLVQSPKNVNGIAAKLEAAAKKAYGK